MNQHQRRLTQDVPEHERPLSERYRIAANAWVKADGIARLKEEFKTSEFETMKTKLIATEGPTAENKLERIVKSSPEWRDYIIEMVTARTEANILKVTVKELEILERETQDRNHTIRAEMRMSR
jgi:hypothetical protein